MLSLDLGTSSAHAVLIDRRGRTVATSRASLRYHRPEDGSDLAKECHPAEVMDAVGDAVGGPCGKSWGEIGMVEAVDEDGSVWVQLVGRVEKNGLRSGWEKFVKIRSTTDYEKLECR